MDAQPKKTDIFNQDSGFSLAPKQYDLILNYLKSGVMPAQRDIREAEMGNLDGAKVRKRAFSRFKSIARRLRYRASDNSLIFHANSKIVLPNDRFADVIKEAHQSKGDKHLNITKTLEKLSEKYTTGCRQFGINEEMVREVIRSCSQGSCAKYFSKTTEFRCRPFKKKLKLDSSVPTSSANTVETQGAALKPLRIKPHVPNNPDSTLVAIPCLIPTSTAGSFPLRQCLVFTGTCRDNKNLSNLVQCRVSSSGETQSVVSSKGSVSQLLFLPGPSTPTPNPVKLLTTESGTSQSTIGLGGQPGQLDQSINNCPQFITIAPLTNLQVLPQSDTRTTLLTPGPGISSSLTNISQTVGAINLQQGPHEVDKNNNNSIIKESSTDKTSTVSVGGNKDQKQGPEGQYTTRGLTKGCTNQASTEPLQNLHTWNHHTDLHQTEEPYSRLVEGIKAMQPDVFKALAGIWPAAEQLKNKITLLQETVRHLKQMSESVGMDSDDDEVIDLL